MYWVLASDRILEARSDQVWMVQNDYWLDLCASVDADVLSVVMVVERNEELVDRSARER